MLILLIDGNPLSAGFIRGSLVDRGFQVDIAGDTETGLPVFERGSYDMVILDVVLPHIDGYALCRQIRRLRADLPILILTGLGDTQDIVVGLESGADDYLLKPFHLDELLARIHALLRRKLHLSTQRTYTAGDLEVDAVNRVAIRGGKTLQLTSTEFSLLILLLEHKNKVLSRPFISMSIWGMDFERRTNLLSVYINYLRSKIDKGFHPPLIHTIVNEGYMLSDG